MARHRLDAELVRRGLVRSRAEAADAIAAGRVTVDGAPAGNAAHQVAPDQQLVVTAGGHAWASRGGVKLAGGLEALGVPVRGRACLDAGASTGGFTDVLLQHGAASVVAVDVGYGQLDHRLATDPRVTVLDRTNVRHLVPADVPGPAPELVVADLSFISLTLVLPALVAVAAPGADLVLLVKPQFEVGRGAVGSGGVVRDPAARAAAVARVADAADALGCTVVGAVDSPLPGPKGNLERFLHVRRGGEREQRPQRSLPS